MPKTDGRAQTLCNGHSTVDDETGDTLPEPDRVMAPRSRKVRLAIILGVMLGALDGGIIAPILPAISHALTARASGLPWLASAYFLGTALAAPAWGGMGDSHGHEVVVKTGLMILTVSTLACAGIGIFPTGDLVSEDLQFAAARLIQGIGSAAIFTGGFAMLSEFGSARQRVGRSGFFSLVFAIATMCGPVVAGMISDHASYRWGEVEVAGWRFVFLSQIPIALIAILLMPLRASGKAIRQGKFDYLGLALIGLIAVLSTTLLNGLKGQGGSGTSAVIAAGIAVGLTALFHVERRAERPLLPPDLLAIELVRHPCVGSALTAAALTCLALSIPGSLQKAAHMSAASSGTYMVALSFGFFAGTMANGYFVGRTGRAREAGLFFTTLGLGALVGLALQPPGERPALLAILFLIGGGLGPLQPMQMILMQAAVPAHRRGSAAGMMNFFRRLGSWGGGTIGGLALAHNLYRPSDTMAATQWPYALPALVCVALLFANLNYIRRYPRDRILE